MKKLLVKTLCFTLSLCCVMLSACKTDENNNPNNEQASFTEITLAENQTTEYAIVLPSEPSEPEKYAASLLADNFQLATGATLSVISDDGQTLDESKRLLSIGRTTILSSSEMTLSESELTCEGYKVKRFGNTVVLCGVEEAGTIYAVQEFLNKEFGYELYAADEIYIEEKETVKLFDFDIADKPTFWGRFTDGLLSYNENYAIGLRLRNRYSSVLGEGCVYDFIPGNSHTFKMIINPEIYNNKELHPESFHPELFSGKQICLTNSALIDEFVKNLQQMILNNPKAKIVNMSEEDFGDFCKCDLCVVERNKYSTSGYLIRFCNTVIQRLEKWLADEKIERNLIYTTFAYTSGMSIIPPVKEKMEQDGTITYELNDSSCSPHEKLYIRLAPLSPVCWYHPLDDMTCETNSKGVAKYIAGWKVVTDRFMIWDYDTNFKAYYAFFDDYGTLQKNLHSILVSRPTAAPLYESSKLKFSSTFALLLL